MSIADTNQPSLSLGDWLLEAGWRQGTIFSSPSVCFALNKLSDLDASEPVAIQRRKTKSDEKFVLITQNCDIKASEDREPYMEALLCKCQKQKFLSRVGPNSARHFVIDFERGLVAEAMYRVSIAKQVLKTLVPEPWPGSAKRLEMFVRWLARRYDRPALPDAMVEVFQKPIEQAFVHFSEEYPDTMLAFSKAVHEIRINLPAAENPPFDLQLTLLISDDGLSSEQADAIDIIAKAIHASLDPKEVYLHPEVRILTEERISMAEYYVTRPLFLENHTYRGEEVEGLEPFGRV